jgi:hypothetical protein
VTLYGWDLSDFDWPRGVVDMIAARNDGISFVTHKATEGTTVRHARYGQALNAAKAAQIEFTGAYMVVRTPGNNGHGPVAAQVDYLLAYVDAATPWWRGDPGFFFQVDLEPWDYDHVLPAFGVQACDVLRARTGKGVLLYAPRWAYADTIPGAHPLWASDYGSNPAVHYRSAYPGDAAPGWGAYSGRQPAILQFGSRTTIATHPTCDANAFRGGAADFRALIRDGGADTVDPVVELALKVAFAAPYDGYTGISGQSWMSKAVETPLRTLVQAAADQRTRDAAAAATIAGLQAAVGKLSDTLAALALGGTGIPLDGATLTSAITDTVKAEAQAVRDLVERHHADQINEMRHQHDAEISGLLAEVAALRGESASTSTT